MTDKEILALDYDDHIAPFIVPFRQWMLEVHNYDMGEPQKPVFSMSEAYGSPAGGTWDEYIHDFTTNASFERQVPDDDAIETIKELSKIFKLHVITSRPAEHKEVTALSIEKHIGEYIEELHLPTQEGGNPIETDKGVICKKIDAKALFDDADHNVAKAMNNGVQAVLMKREYHYFNGLHVPKGTLVVRSWNELGELARERYDTGRWPIQRQSLPAGSYYSIR